MEFDRFCNMCRCSVTIPRFSTHSDFRSSRESSAFSTGRFAVIVAPSLLPSLAPSSTLSAINCVYTNIIAPPLCAGKSNILPARALRRSICMGYASLHRAHWNTPAEIEGQKCSAWKFAASKGFICSIARSFLVCVFFLFTVLLRSEWQVFAIFFGRWVTKDISYILHRCCPFFFIIERVNDFTMELMKFQMKLKFHL